MTDTNISKVYLFLAQQGDWVSKADQDSDGVIIKREFNTFMKENFDWNGEESNCQDIIDQFWKTVDTNTTGKVAGTRLKNKYALDKNEMNFLQAKIEAYEILNDYVNDTVSKSIPSFITSTNDRQSWLTSVKESLANHIEQNLSKAKNLSDIKSDEIKKLLEAQGPISMNKTTANFAAQQYLKNIKNLPQNYNIKADETLQSIIDNYVKSLKGTEKVESIQINVQEIVEAYMNTANIGKYESAADLEFYGYDSSASSKINGLQAAVVQEKMNPVIKAKIDEIVNSTFASLKDAESVKAEFRGLLTNAVEAPVADFINNLTKADFAKIDDKIKSFDVTKYISTSETNELYQNFFEKRLDDMLGILGNDLVNGITQEGNSTFKNVLNESTKSIKLDALNVEKYIENLESAGKIFISSYINSGKNIANLETELRNFLVKYVSGEGIKDVKSEITNINDNYGYIKDSQLAEYKEKIKPYVALLLTYSPTLKLGDNEITSSNYKSVIDAYKSPNQLKTDIQIMVNKAKSTTDIYTFMEASKSALETVANANISANAATLAPMLETVRDEKIQTIIQGKSRLRTQFSIDSNGNITFTDSRVKSIYNELLTQVKTQFESTEDGKEALAGLGGDEALTSLLRSAWIMTYNSYNASEENAMASFINKVLENLQKMLTNMGEHPEYMKLYTMKPSFNDSTYFNSNNIIHYGTNTTLGNDQDLIYKGGYITGDDGIVKLSNDKDSPDYEDSMHSVLVYLKKKYASLVDEAKITEIFRNAQKQALDTCVNNKEDLPTITSSRFGRSRSGDHHTITVQELVDITLYYFDKLLLQELNN